MIIRWYSIRLSSSKCNFSAPRNHRKLETPAGAPVVAFTFDIVGIANEGHPESHLAMHTVRSDSPCLQMGPPTLSSTDQQLAGFLWYMWGRAAQKQFLQGVRIAETVVMVNGRIKAWLFFSVKQNRVRCQRQVAIVFLVHSE